MGETMTPIPFGDLINWAEQEYRREGSAFGVRRFYKKSDDKMLSLFGEKLETPFGPAAGPHTQLAQNIIAGYLAGCRFFELKTVQIIDGEEIAKCIARPCIVAKDECYNCEWSTELTAPQAFDEYVKAYFALKLLSREWRLGSDDGFIFNMSVGYDLEGIRSEKIDRFIEGLKDASSSDIFKECTAFALSHLNRLANWDEDSIRAISPRVSRSITLSTLHGCPPDEIERIATYLISVKRLHTFVKCNPTLLGYEFARKTLDEMGFDSLVFDDHHFKGDLQYEDAVPMFRRLQTLAAENGLSFGVKLTNTFPVMAANKELPSEEIYMSGRSLFPLTSALAYKLSKEFNGKLRISYSGGADAFNIGELYRCGIWPITLATSYLKPGGYERAIQIANTLSMFAFEPFRGVDVDALGALVKDAATNERYKKPAKPLPRRKIDDKVPLFDCFIAPCKGGCPIKQDIPEYVELVGKGKNREALRVIIDKNPLPFITGTICPHHCMDMCTRNYYESPIRIRKAKLTAARNAFDMIVGELQTPPKTASLRVAIVGGGPAGISAAYFLGRSGFAVTVFEKLGSLGGIVKHVIPGFRIKDHAIEQDIQLMEKMGVEVQLNSPVSSAKELLDAGYDAVLLAVGAWAPGRAPMEGEQINVIEFLKKFKNDPESLSLGENVVIIGAGNAAMDAARAAKRVNGVKSVSIVYRRTRKYMPADEEELELCIEDGVTLRELLSPKEHRGNKLVCTKMALGAPDASGRRSPVETAETIEVDADTVIAAVGEGIDTSFFLRNGIELDARGRVKADLATGATNIPGLFVAGDALRGPASVVEAIADARRFADHLTGSRFNPLAMSANAKVSPETAMGKKGTLVQPGRTACENSRCLDCSTVCENCADVCPNRANVAIRVPGKEQRQILHVERMCNECGNCEQFCPYNSKPYKEKFTLFHTKEEFDASDNEGFLVLDPINRRVRVRLLGEIRDVLLDATETGICPEVEAMIFAIMDDYVYLL